MVKIRVRKDLKDGYIIEVEEDLINIGDIENLDKHHEKLINILNKLEDEHNKKK
jgi:hypothetical protein